MGGAEYVVAGLSTLDVSAGDRAEYWASHVRDHHGQMRFDFGEPRGFVGTTLVQRCGEHQLVEFASEHIDYRRTERHIRRDDDRSARLVIPLRGRMVLAQGDHAACLTPGELGMVTLARPLTLAHGDGVRAWILSVPEEAVPAALTGAATLVGDRRDPLLATVVAMTKELFLGRDALSAWQFSALNASLIGLLDKVFHHQHAVCESRLAAIARDAAEYVRKRSDDPGLTPTSIAAHLGCSRRQLELATKMIGASPAQLLRDTRLERARRRLVHRGATVSEAAFDSGFSSLSAFREAFRTRYGVPPAELAQIRR